MYYKNTIHCNTEKHHNNAIHFSNVIPFSVREENIRMLTRAAPCPCPNSVTLLGSPLKAAMLSWTHCSTARMSIRAWLPWAELCPVFRKPICVEPKLYHKRFRISGNVISYFTKTSLKKFHKISCYSPRIMYNMIHVGLL